MEGKKFTRMAHSNPLVEELNLENTNCPEWWKYIVNLTNEDNNFNAQVRGNYLNTYYLMRNFMKIQLIRNGVVAWIHRKYIPFETNIEKDYLKLVISDNKINIGEPYEGKMITEDLLRDNHLTLIKKEIEKYVGEEKRYQSKLIEKNNGTILDAEIAMTGKEAEDTENTQIDLINYDKGLGKLVAIEVKLIGDSRHYSGEIVTQVRNYHKFLKHNSPDIAKAYQNVISVKKGLGLVDKDAILNSIENQDLGVKIEYCFV